MIKKCKNAMLGISEIVDGDMHLSNSQSVINRRKYFEKIDLKNLPVVSARLADGNKVRIIKNQNKNRTVNGVDALITNEKDLILSVTTADCLPIYFYESSLGVIGIVHVGWRGLLNQTITNTIKAMKNEYGVSVRKIKIMIGPHIQKCHFEVKDDVWLQFKKYDSARIEIDSKKYIDLSEVAVSQAKKLGILKSNIVVSRKCTHRLRNRYFSFRRDKILKTMINFIVCKK